MPEHMWIEDRTNGRTYDTFINRGGIALRGSTGVDGQDFQPGCEGHSFSGDNIKRVRVDGYTMGQLIAITAGAEHNDAVTNAAVTAFPVGIADEPAILAAQAAVQSARDAVVDGDVASEEFRVTTREGAQEAFQNSLEPAQQQVPEQQVAEQLEEHAAEQVSSLRSTLTRFAVGVGIAAGLAAVAYLASRSSNQPG
jgi:hypothetical protein